MGRPIRKGSKMTERPILFNDNMVRAILENQKTQTRRVINRLLGFGKITAFDSSSTDGYNCDFRDNNMRWNSLTKKELLAACPYGQVGDELWCKETWALIEDPSCFRRTTITGIWDLLLDHKTGRPKIESQEEMQMKLIYEADHNDWGGGWKSPLYMPRKYSRLQLLIKDVRVERLQNISEEDAMSEGVIPAPFTKAGRKSHLLHVEAFEELWESINAKRGYPWQFNPWVWVIEFEQLKGPKSEKQDQNNLQVSSRARGRI